MTTPLEPYSADDIKRKKRRNGFDLPGTPYKIQLGQINNKWTIHLLNGKNAIDSYVFKEENKSAYDFPNQNLIVEWVLKTIAIPNINPHLIMKTVQSMTKQITNYYGDYNRKEIVRVFEYEESEEDFGELEIEEDVPLHSLLGSDFILLFFSPAHKKVYHWIGNNTTPKMRYGAANRVGNVRDMVARGYLIRTEDEGEESLGFKIIVGLVEQEDDERQEDTKPLYNGTQDKELTSQRILILLEKMPVPEGYERDFVIVNNEIFRYKEYSSPSYKADLLNKRLLPLEDEIDDGTYTFEDCLPRILFSYNKIKVIELLKKKFIN